MNSNSLTIFSRGALMLAEANTVQKAKELKSLALTAADWAARTKAGSDAIQYCRSYAMEAERRMGELLRETERAKRGPDKGTTQRSQAVTSEPTLAELGITKNESSKAQKLAALPEEDFQAVRDGLKRFNEVRREIKRAEVREAVKLPDAKFRVIYADPPWAYNDKCDSGSVQSGGCEKHYPSMTIAELCAMPIKSLCEPDAVLFLWVTSPLLFECEPIIGAWGYTYKTSFVWDKVKHNMGHYNSVRHELLLVCTRGSCLPDSNKLVDSVQSIERKKHSEKPEEFREIIETLYPHGKKLELFAREKHTGWETWGNEV